ncbi:S9 family peptidase [Fibrisoma montanum]|nr:prolyl oligopeptidase family serine peptidase [Fibrisoma montanum]
MKLLLIGWLTVCLGGPAFSQSGSGPSRYSIEDVLSAPYCAGLVGEPQAGRIAWVSAQEGIRTVFVHNVRSGQTTALTNYQTDDGQDISDLHISADGRWLAFVRGGAKNSEGVSPNPTSSPAGAEQAVYLLPTDGSRAPVRVSPGNQPVFSPTGKRLLFVQGGQVYLAEIPGLSADKPVNAPVRLFTARGSQSDVTWSPDGGRVLFSSVRGYHNFIGVYDLSRKVITWLAPGVDRDQSPVWSPDGSQVAFIRVPGKKHGEMENVQGGHRFAIWVADVATGEGRTLWQSPADDGGFAQDYPAEPLRWTASNKLLFFSEHEGWMHLYALSPTGGKLTDMTPGAAEAEETAVPADGRYVYYSTNLNDIDRRHIWRVALTDAGPVTPEPLTTGTGIETDPVVVGDQLFYRSASWNRSTGIAKRRVGDSSQTLLFPAEPAPRFPTMALTEPKQIVFKAADGVEVHAQLFLPNSTSQTPRPALVFMHGGPMRQMLLGWHYRGSYYANAYAMNQYLASQGYVVLSVNYRAGIGYGRAFRRADRQGPRGASEYQDILAAAKYLQSRPDVNPLKIGLWGGSYGGYLTALGLARNSDLFACGVDIHGVHDWAWRGNHFSPGGGWAIGEAEAKVAFESSPAFNLDFWRSPCLFVHADDDRNVTFAETVDLVQKLRDKGVPTEVLIFPDDVHSFLLHKNWVRTYQALDVFFRKHLMSQPEKPLTSEK